MFSTRSASVKPRSLVQAVAHVVAVEQIGVFAERVQRFSTRLAMVDLPAPDRPVNHSMHLGFWCFISRRAPPCHIQRLPVDVVARRSAK
jgi:hypothetical protein